MKTNNLSQKLLILLLAVAFCSASSGVFNPWYARHPQLSPPGNINIFLNNSTGLDLMVDSTCRATQGDPIPLPKNGSITLPLNFTGNNACQVIGVQMTDQNTTTQAVLCLDANGCEAGCNTTDCAGGVCDNIGIKWIRGGDLYYAQGDTCVRKNPVKGISDTAYINYGITITEVTPHEAAQKIFKGGDISLYLFQNTTPANYQILLNDKHINPNPPQDYAKAISNFNEIYYWMGASGKTQEAEKLKNAFCDVALNDPTAVQMRKNQKGGEDQINKLQGWCKGTRK